MNKSKTKKKSLTNRPRKVTRIRADKITLSWTCPECNAHFVSLLDCIVENGTAICSECGTDCELDASVTVEDFEL